MHQIKTTSSPFFYIFASILFFACPGYSEQILVIGDSQGCGSFGTNFVKNLSAQGHDVTLYCMPGSTPTNWLRQTLPKGQKCKTMTSKDSTFKLCGEDGNPPQIDDLLQDPKLTRVIVELGGNSLYSQRPDPSYSSLAQKIFKNEKACDWLGPAWRQPEKNKANRENLEKANQNIPIFAELLEIKINRYCTFIDSKDATGPGTQGNETTDGVHRTEAAGKNWAHSLAQRYRSSSPFKRTHQGAR